MSLSPIKTHILEHVSRIRNRIVEALLVTHWMKKDLKESELHFLDIFKFKPHLYNQENVHRILLQKEAFWIHKLQSRFPNSFNQNLDLSCFI